MDFLKEAEFITNMLMNEGVFVQTVNALGETNFTKTDGSEFYIQEVIHQFAESQNITTAEAQKKFQDAYDKTLADMDKSPKINGTMISNIAETIAFQMLETIKPTKTDTKFEFDIFRELFAEVKSEADDLYPLTNPFEPRRIEPKIFEAPDPLYPEFNGVTTAACSPTAQLIFNKPFMTKLIKFAEIKGIKADPTKLHGKKYESRGGNIPDSYLYCEFVLIHELKHYQNGDFFFEKKFNLDGTLVNYTGDFVTNYDLVKSGYAQLPIGLFNDEINYDRFNSYQAMYDLIEEEMDKLSKQEQEDMQNKLDEMGDNMPAKGEGADPDKSDRKYKPPGGGEGPPKMRDMTPEEEAAAIADAEAKNRCYQDCLDAGGVKDECGEKCYGKPEEGGGPPPPPPPPEGVRPSDKVPPPLWEPDFDQDDQNPPPKGDGQDGEGQDGEGQDGEGQDGEKKDGEKKDGKGGAGDENKSPEEKQKEADEAEARAKANQEAEDAGKSSGKVPSDAGKGKKKGRVPDSIDRAIKENQRKSAENQADPDKETKTGMNPNAAKPGDLANSMAGNNNGGNGLGMDGNPYELAERSYTPKLNWKQLLKKMVPSGTTKDETYSKPSRRSTSSMVTVAQTGVGVVKPGTKENPSDKKGLCFVLDESGSTMNKIGEMKASILKLMEKHSKQLNGTMYMIKFSNDVHFFKIDLKKMKYGRVINYNDFINTGRIDVKCTKNARDLFKSTYGGGTELDSKVANIVKKLKTKLNFNTILFSDSDVAYGSNAETLKSMYKQLGTKSFALIGCDNNDYKAFADLLGDKNNITHF